MRKAHAREKLHLVKKALAGEKSHIVGRAHAKERLHLDLLAEYNKNTHTDHRQGFFLALNVCVKWSIKCRANAKHSCHTTTRLEKTYYGNKKK